MTTYNTGNPAGSAAPKDLYDNAENLDNLANGSSPSYTDRLGTTRKSWAGMEADFQAFLVASGYVGTGSGGAYEDYDTDGPLTITALNQIFTKSGEFYRAAADTTLPYTTTGTWSTDQVDFVSVGDAALRAALAAVGGSMLVRHCDSLTELKALSPTADGQTADIVQGGRAGRFRWTTGDFTSEAAADAEEGAYVKADGIAVSVGMWARENIYGLETGQRPVLDLYHFGGSSTVDSSAAWNSALAVLALFSGGAIKMHGIFGFSSAVTLEQDNVTVKGLSAESENSVKSGFKKIGSWASGDLLTVGDGVTANTGIKLKNLFFDGDGKAGDGLVLQKLGNCSFETCRSENHLGWGLRRDGLWLCQFNKFGARNNGAAGTDSGGIKDTFVIRESANMTCEHVYANNNYNHQMLWDHSPEANHRMVSYSQHSGIYELPANDAGALFEARCGDRCQFFGTRFPQEASILAPAVILGDSVYNTGSVSVTNGSATVTGSGTSWLANVSAGEFIRLPGEDSNYEISSVDSDTQITLTANYTGSTASGISYNITESAEQLAALTFYSFYSQQNASGTNYCVKAYDNVHKVAFYEPQFVGNDRMIDASDMYSGAIMLVGGDVESSEHSDPNEVITGFDPGAAFVGLRPGTSGDQWVIRMRDDKPVWVQFYDSSGNIRSLKLGEGTDDDQVFFEGCNPRLQALSAAPSNPSANMLAMSNGTSGGFDGSSGAGLYRRDNANSSWVFIG